MAAKVTFYFALTCCLTGLLAVVKGEDLEELQEAYEFFQDVETFYNYWISVVSWLALVFNSLAFFGWCILGHRTDAQIRMILMCLAISDILALVSLMDAAIFFWSDNEWSVMQSTDIGCKLIQYTVNSARNCSSYFILFFTFDRFLSVWFPMKRKQIMTVTTTAVGLVAIVVCSSLAELYIFYEVYHRKSAKRCFTRDRHDMSVYQSILRNGLGFMLPMVIVAFLNALVIRRLWKYQDYLSRDPAASGISKKAEARNYSLTVMLVVVSIFSFVVFLPKTIVFYMMLDGAYDYRKTLVRTFRFSAAVYIVDAIAMLNYTCNFFFYCLGTRRFRRLLKKPFVFVQESFRSSRGRRGGADLNGSVSQSGTTKVSDTFADTDVPAKPAEIQSDL